MSLTAIAVIRFVVGLGLLAVPIWAGFAARSPWILLPLALGFGFAYAAGKRPAWAQLFREGPLASILKAIALTLIIQMVVVAIFYLIGRGMGALFGIPDTMTGLAALDVLASIVVVLLGMVGLVLPQTADEAGVTAPVQHTPAQPARRAVRVTPVTIENFFQGRHFLHPREDDTAQTNTTPMTLTDAEIAAAEQKLGIVLPDGLRALYGVQNGGHVGDLTIPDPNEANPDKWCFPFSGYSDLVPLTTMWSVNASIETFADPETEPDRFVAGGDRLMILAQWYQETLFLDYRFEGAPSVGFVDFDVCGDLREDTWQQKARTWPDFKDFFAELQRLGDDY